MRIGIATRRPVASMHDNRPKTGEFRLFCARSKKFQKPYWLLLTGVSRSYRFRAAERSAVSPRKGPETRPV
jgi:hypothetical protein